MDVLNELNNRHQTFLKRRQFIKQCGLGLGGMTLGSLLGCQSSMTSGGAIPKGLQEKIAHFAPNAKRVIFLHMAGAPSQLELFDYKPKLYELDGQTCPDSLLDGKRFAFIKGVPKMLGPRVILGTG